MQNSKKNKVYSRNKGQEQKAQLSQIPKITVEIKQDKTMKL